MQQLYTLKNNLPAVQARPLPKAWGNVSGLDKADPATILAAGWVPVTVVDVALGEHQKYGDDLVDIAPDQASVTVTRVAVDMMAAEIKAAKERQLEAVRAERDHRMNAFSWAQERYNREARLSLPHTFTQGQIDAYMQALADVPAQPDPYNIVWPAKPGGAA